LRNIEPFSGSKSYAPQTFGEIIIKFFAFRDLECKEFTKEFNLPLTWIVALGTFAKRLFVELSTTHASATFPKCPTIGARIDGTTGFALMVLVSTMKLFAFAASTDDTLILLHIFCVVVHRALVAQKTATWFVACRAVLRSFFMQIPTTLKVATQLASRAIRTQIGTVAR
jgi:hypothetical protein